jgi:TatD DNase family protein
VPLTVRALAEVKNMDLTELCEELTRTAERVFGTWDDKATTNP